MVRKPEVRLPLTIRAHLDIVVEDDVSHQGFQCERHQETSRLQYNIHVRKQRAWVMLKKTYAGMASVSEGQIPRTCSRHHVVHTSIGSAGHEAEPIECIRVLVVLLVEVGTKRRGHERPCWNVRPVRKRECL